ncbi:MAG: hypothetical protein HQL69_18520 [Magnetococcales bacterium]|nr:hypothetical protein [Magnetococcales bacterium]
MSGNNYKITTAASKKEYAGMVVFFGFIGCTVALLLQVNPVIILTICAVLSIVHQIISIPGEIWNQHFFRSLHLQPPNPDVLVETLFNMANIARKYGILELDKYSLSFRPLQSATNNCVDGSDPDFLESILKQEANGFKNEVHLLRRTVLFVFLTVSVLIVGMALLNFDEEGLIYLHGFGLLLVILFAIWNHWRLEVYEARMGASYNLITLGIVGIQRGVNPLMLQELLQATGTFNLIYEPDELQKEEKREGASPTQKAVSVALDHYLAKYPPVKMKEPAFIPAKKEDGVLDLFMFSDLVCFDDNSIQTLLRELSNDDLLLALKGATPEVAKLLIGNIGPKAAIMLIEDLEMMGPVRAIDVEDSQRHILKVLARLESEGEIINRKSHLSLEDAGDGPVLSPHL